MCVHFLFAVDAGGGSGELQQLVGLVDHQRGLELAQPEQVAAEHPTEAKKEQVMRGRRNKHLHSSDTASAAAGVKLYLWTSLMYVGRWRRRLLLSSITRIK